MKLPKMKDEAFLGLARDEDNRSIAAGSMRGVFRTGREPLRKLLCMLQRSPAGARRLSR